MYSPFHELIVIMMLLGLTHSNVHTQVRMHTRAHPFAHARAPAGATSLPVCSLCSLGTYSTDGGTRHALLIIHIREPTKKKSLKSFFKTIVFRCMAGRG
jgi:hypothetical protein